MSGQKQADIAEIQRQAFKAQRSKMLLDIEQLRMHCCMDRVPVSRTTKDIIDFCQQGIASDPLIYPIKENPFKEKKSCAII